MHLYTKSNKHRVRLEKSRTTSACACSPPCSQYREHIALIGLVGSQAEIVGRDALGFFCDVFHRLTAFAF